MLSSGQGHMLEVLCLLANWPMLRSRSACTDTQRSRRTRKQRAHAQVAHLFARALVVVAPHGGTLANLMFAAASRAREEDGVWVGQAPMRVLELLPANRPNLCYERLCRSLGTPHFIFACLPALTCAEAFWSLCVCLRGRVRPCPTVVCVCVCVCVCVFICICLHIYLNLSIYKYQYVYEYIYIFMYVCLYIYVY